MTLVSSVVISVFQSFYIYLLLCFLGLPSYLLLRRLRSSIPFSLNICLIAGLFWISIISWYAFVLGLRLALAYKIVLIIAILLIIIQVFCQKTPLKILSRKIKDAVVVIIPDVFSFLVCILVYSYIVISKLKPDALPLVTVTNADLLMYLKLGNYLKIFPDGLQMLVAMDFKEAASHDVFGSFNLISFIAVMVNTGVENVAIPALGLALGIFGAAIARSCRLIFRLGVLLSILIAVLTVTSPLISYIALNYFLSQILFVGILITTASLLIETCDIQKQNLLYCIAVLFLSSATVMLIYPVWLLQYVFMISILFAVLRFRLSSPITVRKLAASIIIRFISFVIICSLFLCSISFARFSLSIKQIMQLSIKNVAGWPLSFISPDLLIGLPDEWHSKDVHPLVFGQSLLLFLFTSVLFVLLWKYDRKGKRYARRLYIAIFSACAAAYILIWHHYGLSYQQWKFATTLPVSFGFCILAATAYLATAYLSRFRLRLTRSLFACIFCTCIGANLMQIYNLPQIDVYNNLDVYHFPKSLESAKIIDKMPDIDIAYIDIYQGLDLMAAALFINYKPIIFSGGTYFGPKGLQPPIASDHPYAIVKSGCGARALENDYITVKSTDPQGISPGTSIPFGKKLDGCLDIVGFGAVEAGGRWTDGHHASIRLRCACDLTKDDSIYVVLTTKPFLLDGYSNHQRGTFKVNNGESKFFNITQKGDQKLALKVLSGSLDPQSIDIEIDLPDAISPALAGSSDSRTLGLYVENIEVIHRN